MLVNSDSILNMAMKKGYAIGAYSINNLDWIRYILEACNEDKSPVILSVAEKSVDHLGGLNAIYNVVKSLIKDLNIKIPVVLHLDYIDSFSMCKKAVDKGFTSIMLDTPLESDIKEAIKYAKNKGVSVEIAKKGNTESSYTDPYDAKNFVIETGVDSLSVFVGNKSNMNKKLDLDFKLLGEICRQVKIPVVMHNVTELTENEIKTVIFCGVCKIDVDIDWHLKHTYNNKIEYDSGKIGAKIKALVHEKNVLFGSKQRAI